MSETVQKWNEIPPIIENPYQVPRVPLGQAIMDPNLLKNPKADVPLYPLPGTQGK